MTEATFEYVAPGTLREACFLLSRHRGNARVMAGGTDFVVLNSEGQLTPQYAIDIKGIPGLDYIRHDDKGTHIGALVTMSDLESSDLVRQKLPMLASAVSEMGTPQIRNTATIAGNICRSSPAADTATPLVCLGASVKLVSIGRQRSVPIEEFFSGAGQNVLEEDEILAGLLVPDLLANARGVYLRWTNKTRVAIASASVAALVRLVGGKVASARIVLGAVAPTPVRAREAEAVLTGKTVDDKLIEQASLAALDQARPISDVRSPAGYRREMIRVLTARALSQAIGN